MAVRKNRDDKFQYENIEIFRDLPCLGSGAYGVVYHAQCDDLPCAAKVLHSSLFEGHTPGTERLIELFYQEINFLKEVRHPCIILYLQVVTDAKTGFPVLLMEKMDESLTSLLERSPSPLPFHVQVDICHDVALAMAYLHSRDIVHRDLSSNNILIVAGRRAKVSDFGICRYLKRNNSKLSAVPGTAVYMPPEVFGENVDYDTKIDCFSFGPLTIQIITRKYPTPGPPTTKVADMSDPRCPHGVLTPVPEEERRREDIALVMPKTHPLLPVVIECLRHKPSERPNASELCARLALMKKTEEYRGALRKRKKLSSVPECHVDREKVIQKAKGRSSSSIPSDILINGTGHTHKVSESSSDVFVNSIDHTHNDTDHTHQTVLSESSSDVFVNSTDHTHSDTDHTHGDTDHTHETVVSENGIHHHTSKFDSSSDDNTGCALRPIVSGSATVCGDQAFFRPAKSNNISVFNFSMNRWLPKDTVPPCPNFAFTLVTINDHVTAVGGHDANKRDTNSLLSLIRSDRDGGSSDHSGGGSQWSWADIYTPMPTCRSLVAAAHRGRTLVVAGGTCHSKQQLKTVEVMDSDNHIWYVAGDLPYPIVEASLSISDQRVYVVGGYLEHDEWMRRVLTCSVKSLLQTSRLATERSPFELPSVWVDFVDIAVRRCASLSIDGNLVIVSGKNSRGERMKEIQRYSPRTNSWDVVGVVSVPRTRCLAAALPGQRVMVVGGWVESGGGRNERRKTNLYEIVSLKL